MPEPVLIHVPPVCSPVIKSDKLIATVLFSQTGVLPSLPAFGVPIVNTPGVYWGGQPILTIEIASKKFPKVLSPPAELIEVNRRE